MKKISGELKYWLPISAQFKKIHDDDRIDNDDKFHYLAQLMIPGSRAKTLVESFPAICENYPKAIECLKSRFGKKDLLVEVYIREMLSLVIQNATSIGKVSLLSLYDNLECHLRALETLKITTDTCAPMLLPLVESCLPEEVLRVWQRTNALLNVNYIENKICEDSTKRRLDQLMNFLRSKIENEQKVKLALASFVLEKSVEKKRFVKQDVEKILPTATGLLAGNSEVKCHVSNEKGPEWLRNLRNCVPICQIDNNEKEINQKKRVCVKSSQTLICTVEGNNWYYKRFSNYRQCFASFI